MKGFGSSRPPGEKKKRTARIVVGPGKDGVFVIPGRRRNNG